MKLRALIARIAVLCMLPVMAWKAAYDATRVLDVAASRSNKVLEQARDLVAFDRTRRAPGRTGAAGGGEPVLQSAHRLPRRCRDLGRA